MKRHLVYPMDFDTRAHLLSDPRDSWDKTVRELHISNQQSLIARLKIQLGDFNFEKKLEDFKDLGASPFSIVSYHNTLFHQSRYAFIHGLYYPALTSACALGERILNHLILDLKDSFKDSHHYKKIRLKQSTQDWGVAITILDDWKIFQHPDVVSAFHELKDLRMRSLHFNESTIAKLRDEALNALKQLTVIISLQFGFLYNQTIPGTAGGFFLRKESENLPFVREYYLPQCPLVGPYYSMKFSQMGWLIFDWNNYESKEIGDAEFANLYSSRKPEELVPDSIPWDSNISVELLANGTRHPVAYRNTI